MNWIITILSTIIIGAIYGGIAGNAISPSNQKNKIVQNRMTKYSIICLALLSCNFFFSIAHGIFAIVLGYIIQMIIGSGVKEPISNTNTIDVPSLSRMKNEIVSSNRNGWITITAAIVHIDNIPKDVINTAVFIRKNLYNLSSNKFPEQNSGYDGVIWIERENIPYMPFYRLMFMPKFSSIDDEEKWGDTMLELCIDLESWLEIKEITERILVTGDGLRIAPMANDRDFAILSVLLKTKKYKDVK